MTERNIPFDNIKASANDLLSQAFTSLLPNMEAIAQLYENRSTRLKQVADRLEPTLGESHRRVVDLRQAVLITNELERTLKTATVRQKRRPSINPNDWGVFGQILNRASRPVAGLKVVVSDRANRLKDLRRETNTDEYGDFSVLYYERDFAKYEDTLPALFVQVNDSKGNLLFSSDESIRYSPGQVKYFEVRLKKEIINSIGW